MTPAGNFEGHNILNRLKHATAQRAEDEDAARRVARKTARRARQPRVRPGLDDKVLADWNGLMIAALANAGLMFDEPSWLEHGANALSISWRAR